MSKTIYLDNAATSKMRPEVLEAMMPYLTEDYANPSSIHDFGIHCSKVCEEARKKVAKVINAKENEIYFTSGGSESDNWAIKSVVQLKKEKGKAHNHFKDRTPRGIAHMRVPCPRRI